MSSVDLDYVEPEIVTNFQPQFDDGFDWNEKWLIPYNLIKPEKTKTKANIPGLIKKITLPKKV